MIKSKCHLGLFNLFVRAISWLTLFLFCGLAELDGQLGYWRHSIDAGKNCCYLIRIVFIEKTDKLPEMLNY